jgi:hypothetical protein
MGKMKNVISVALVVMTVAVLTGCRTSVVHFEEPAGTRMTIDGGEEYTFPAIVELRQTELLAAQHRDVGGRPISMVLPDGTKLKGFIHVYKVNMDQVERLAKVTFRLTYEQIAKLKDGYAVTVVGYSAGGRAIYKINLGLDA